MKNSTIVEKRVLLVCFVVSWFQTQEFDQTGRKSIADDYDYVMFGKIFKFKRAKEKKELYEIYVSFGGLLMMLRGDQTTLEKFEVDQQVYLLIRKVE